MVKVLFLFFVTIALLAVNVSAADEEDDEKEKLGLFKSVNFDPQNPMKGRYELATDPDNDEFSTVLTAMDFTEENIEVIKGLKTIIIEISKGAGEGEWSVKFGSRKKNFTYKFVLGEEFMMELVDGRKVKTTINLKGHRVQRNMKFENFEVRSHFDFDEHGFKGTWECKGKEASLDFKRLASGSDSK